jgi:Lrp/AsnC family transcriptional regulator for asnA, asnC and gidA
MIDNISREIIFSLHRDGRTSNVKLAQELGINVATVAKRIDALLRENLITIRAVQNPFKTGYRLNAFISLDVDLKKVKDVCEILVDSPRTSAVLTCFGRFDIILIVDLASWEMLLDFVQEDISQVEGINQVEINLISEVKKRSYGAFADYAATKNNATVQLDEINQRLIEELEKNGRLGYADLAEKLGVSAATISRRVSFLTRENIIKIMAIPNMSKLGFPANAFMNVHAERSKVNDICAELYSYPEVHTVMTLIDSFNIIVGAHFPAPEIMYDFILEKIAYIDGVLNIETLVRAELRKTNYVPDIALMQIH